ncbi:VCBS repeat-containing protein [Aquabacterium sp. A7-Y]|uniref:FG-GAP repeat domain-containing protein n=1 Tax=Aquabacterium sp. A7-Y TaxID=1349605 RepID=UPI00223D25B8|nr:VCBS repeat-containing protein [Aquabacterium sp. A7-Y]MCW7540102.1 VCBS repeat-containing protein [Aquabacterium sp. A7-Y]
MWGTMARRLIISMLDLVERPLGRPGWSEAVTRSRRPEQKRLEALLLDPQAGWSAERLDLRYPGAAEAIDCGEFVVSEMGDIDGDGRPEIVFGVTPTGAPSYLLAYRYDRGTWQAEPIYRDIRSVDFIRSVALGDLDRDGCDEIVIGTRPDGAIVLFDRGPSGYTAELIDTQQQGANNSNIREVAIGDIGHTGQPDVFAASARANEPVKWDRVPGFIFRYRKTGGRWERSVIEDHGGQTHTRMLRVGKVHGVEQVVSCAVGVYDIEHHCIDPEPVLQMHTLDADGTIKRETIAVLEEAIKSRSLAIADIDGDGVNELVLGTRSIGLGDHGKTFLYVFKHDAAAGAWTRQTLDTSEPLGFHCVTVADLDDGGRLAVIASDDGKGLIKAYRFLDGAWQAEVILSRPNFIFVNAMGMIHCS